MTSWLKETSKLSSLT